MKSGPETVLNHSLWSTEMEIYIGLRLVRNNGGDGSELRSRVDVVALSENH